MSYRYATISKGLCKEDNKRLRFWIKVKQYDEALQIYREMKKRNCLIDSDLETYMFLRFFKENLDGNDKKRLDFLSKQLIMA